MMKEIVLLFSVINPELDIIREYPQQSFVSHEIEEAWDLCEAAREEMLPSIFMPTHLWELECFEQRSNWPIIRPVIPLKKPKQFK